MNKEQAQKNINELGKSTKLTTRAVNFLHIFTLGALLGGAIGICCTVPVVVISCILFAVIVVFTCATVRQYMNFFRISVHHCGISLFWVAVLNCIAYAILYRVGIFVMWDFCLSIAIQAMLIVVMFVILSVFADGSKHMIWIAVLSVIAVASFILSRCLACVPFHNSGFVIFVTILINIIAGLVAMSAATFAACLYLMRKYGVEYKPEWQSVDDFINETRLAKSTYVARASRVSLYNVYCFEYKTYLLYIYAKDMIGKRCKLLVYDGDMLVLEEKYEDINKLFEQAEIDNNKLSDIWDEVKPL